MMDKKIGREILLDISIILRYCRLPFFLIQGTALGAYRDQGFTPTEKDIDIGVLYEHFLRKWELLCSTAKEYGFEYRTVSAPFDKVRAVKLKRDNIKIDLSSYILWKDKRFCSNSDPALRYSVVYNRSMMETYDRVLLFGNDFLVPSPIESYLELEYGSEWRVPKDDSRSRTRIKNYVINEGIPHDYLQRF